MKPLKIILIQGNGGAKATDDWFPFVKKELKEKGATTVRREVSSPNIKAARIYKKIGY